jgi:predicted Ser/Thr protein kinase
MPVSEAPTIVGNNQVPSMSVLFGPSLAPAVANDETSIRPPGPASPPSPPSGAGGTYSPGSVLLTSFRIEALVASGGMGSVYRATHLLTGATVAVKTIRPEYAADAKMAELFRREAQALRRIAHPAIVRYEGAFGADDGHMVLVMEFVEGKSLMEVLRDGPLPVKDVRALRDRLAAGLAAAHREGVVHRDLSPDNVILPGGRIEDAKIIDFGIARQELADGATLVGDAFAGKLAWAAPEQFGLYDDKVDQRADVFSLGLVLAAAAIGRPLEMGTSINSAVRARSVPIDLSALPAALRKDLEPMLQPDPSKRTASMEALLPVDLRAAWIGARRWRWLAAASVVIAVGATGLAVYEEEEREHLFGKLFGRSAPARKPTASVPVPGAGEPKAHTTAGPATALDGRYGGSACHAGKDEPCSVGVVSVHNGRIIGSWPATDDRLTNIIEGSTDAGGVVRLRWRRIDGSDNLMDQAHLTGTITTSGLRASGKWTNRATDIEIRWNRVD